MQINKPINVITPEQFGQALAARRKHLGLTQADTAKQIGLNIKTISNLENHPQKASVETLFKVMAALNLEVSLDDRQPPDPGGAGDW